MWRNSLFFILALISLSILNACVSSGYNKGWDLSAKKPNANEAPKPLAQDVAWPEPPKTQNVETPRYGTYYGRKQAPITPPSSTEPQRSEFVYNSGASQNNTYSDSSLPATQPAPAYTGPAVKVALLVPMSGRSAELGQAMLNSAQMALFDLNYTNFELMPRDTKGTPEGAKKAAESAVKNGAQLILGPLFSSSVRAASPIAKKHNINMIAFSTDWSLASRNTFVMGFLPFAQIERILDYSAKHGYRTFGLIAPQTTYGDAIINSYKSLAPRYGLQTVETMSFNMADKNISPLIRRFARYDQRRAQMELSQDSMKDEDAPANQGHKEKAEAPFSAVLMPVGGQKAMAIANLLSYYELDPYSVKRIGTGLWDDQSIARDPNMEGAWFAAPSPNLRRSFEVRYRNTYMEKPPRLASLAYDATALAAVLGRKGAQRTGKPFFGRDALTNPNGFSGIDGIFRFNSKGLVERGLAVLEIKNGQAHVIDEAPKSFQRQYQQARY